jgi:hypothetical protein
MRRIAISLSAVSMALAIGFLLANRFLIKHSDPNLAELGLSSDPQQIAAPEDPEPASSTDAGHSADHSSDLFETINGKIPQLEPNLLPASFVDTAGITGLDGSAYRWMPLCGEAAGSGPGKIRSSDHMPRCDDSSLNSLLQNKAKTR